jgi:hypothetical protein
MFPAHHATPRITRTDTVNSGRKTQVDLLLCADYNRHHGLWGGAQVFGEAGRNNEAEAIIDLMQENALTSLLPSRTVTWDHYNGSTVTGDSSVLLRTHISIINNIYCLFEAHTLSLCKSYSRYK